MGRYVRFRAGNGRFRQGSLARDFGIKAWACAYNDCLRFVPLGVSESKPETCPHCKRPFVDIADVPEGRLDPPATPEEKKP